MVVVMKPVTCVLCQEEKTCIKVDDKQYVCGDCVQKVLRDDE